MGTFHACGNTWRYDLKNINQRKSHIFLYEGKNIVICALWWVQSTLSYATTLMQDKLVAYAEKWSSTGKNKRMSLDRSDINVIT